ncbi:MAG TPA: SIS domain-containing protein [Acidimicrobiales bacterium]|nr:SIS domain-containing protein [Acidimicrobiales bacterium]
MAQDGGAGSWSRAHVAELAAALDGLGPALEAVEAWGGVLAERLERGGRLLVAGNGGSAALAEHLAAELVSRFGTTRRGLGALALSTAGSVVTAIAHDFGAVDVFARQVEAHARPDDIVLLLSTSGVSPDLVAAAEEARYLGVTTWAMTGRGPNPLAATCDSVVTVDAPASSTVQEVHQVLVHVLARAVDEAVGRPREAV